MAIGLSVLILVAAAVLLFGAKLAAFFGVVVACAAFHFPLGLIGLVGIGVSLLFVLNPRGLTD